MKEKALFGVKFNDVLVYDAVTKKVVSVRDGVQEYRGSEFGREPFDKIFKIYRSPETIKNLVSLMDGIAITDDHVSLDIDPANIAIDDIVGKVIGSELVDVEDQETDTTVLIKNNIQLDSDTGNYQLSLGYGADLIDCDLYDFEQVDIVPHHLAIVNKGRCGNLCTFTDKEYDAMSKKNVDGVKIHVAFLDAGEEVNMAQVMDIVANLPEAIKTMPIKELAKLVPVLQKVTASAVETVVENTELTPEEQAAAAAEEKKVADEELATKAEAEKAETEKVKMADKKFADALETGIADGIKKGTALFSSVLVKAKNFLPDTYDFTDKCPVDLMRDSLKTVHNDDFTDGELSTAFKMLKSDASYQDFGKGEKGKFADSADKEV